VQAAVKSYPLIVVEDVPWTAFTGSISGKIEDAA
jgi:hypothetical protein